MYSLTPHSPQFEQSAGGHLSLVSLIVTIDHTYSINNPCLQDVDGAERITRFTILYGGAQSRHTRDNKQSDVYASQVYSPPLYIYTTVS